MSNHVPMRIGDSLVNEISMGIELNEYDNALIWVGLVYDISGGIEAPAILFAQSGIMNGPISDEVKKLAQEEALAVCSTWLQIYVDQPQEEES